jgi:mono/diheme cytochrome c family protein
VRLLRAVGRIGLISVALLTALVGIARPRPESPSTTKKEPQLLIKSVALTVITVLVLISAGGLLFVLSGVYPIDADKPHLALIRWLLQTARSRSVEFHSRGIPVPNLGDASLVKQGFVLYRKNCQPCHGAPGVAADQIGLGINPKPPQLVTAGVNLKDSEIYWIISHGLKMSGMPAFSPRLSDTDRWGIVAFLRRLSRLSPAEYRSRSQEADQGLEPGGWGADDKEGFAQIKVSSPERGKQLMGDYGCITCHTIPGRAGAYVGPPLIAFAEREYIAGSLVNLPTNAMNWVMNPKKYKPNTAMPLLGVKPQDAADIIAYLYSLGSPRRLNTIQQTSADVPQVSIPTARKDTPSPLRCPHLQTTVLRTDEYRHAVCADALHGGLSDQ